MKERMSANRYWGILAITFIGLWPIWRWYGLRVYSSSDEMWGVLAIFTAIVFLFASKPHQKQSLRLSWIIPVTLITLYITAYSFLPPLLRAVIAMGLMANLLSQYWFKRHFHVGLSTLLILSLPVVASLQFYLGYPMRVIVGGMTELLLQMNGLAVVREGTVLNWGSQMISIDAPCSGVKMLWVSFYLASVLACFLRLSAIKTITLYTVVLVVVLCGNVFRATALFYLEAGFLPLYNWMHDGVGLVAFLFTACAIVLCGLYIQRKGKWFRESLSYSV